MAAVFSRETENGSELHDMRLTVSFSSLSCLARMAWWGHIRDPRAALGQIQQAFKPPLPIQQAL